jgi:hypothetical protein
MFDTVQTLSDHAAKLLYRLSRIFMNIELEPLLNLVTCLRVFAGTSGFTLFRGRVFDRPVCILGFTA